MRRFLGFTPFINSYQQHVKQVTLTLRSFNVSCYPNWAEKKGSSTTIFNGDGQKNDNAKLDDPSKGKIDNQQPDESTNEAIQPFNLKLTFSSNKNNKMSSSKQQQQQPEVCIRHKKSKNQFTMDLGNGMEARVEYRSIGSGRIDMYHSEVPEELRGRGIGKALAKASFDSALNDKLKVKVTCSYLIDYLDKYADAKYRNLIEK